MNFKELDLVYITENLMAMAFPFDRTKPGNAENGNDINVVAAYMRKKHKDHFMIWNVSEESYDYSKFSDQVLEYKFPGHPAPPLGLLFKICTSVESWLDADESNIAVCHCLTGKGRTAALMACVLAWIGEFTSPMEALQYIADRRGISVDNLTIPSQRRYVQYFSNMLDGVKPRSEPLLLRRIIINSIPIFGKSGVVGSNGEDGSGAEGCCPYLQLFKNGKLIATATPQVEHSAAAEGDSVGKGGSVDANKMQLRWINASEGSVSFTLDCAIQGDILLRCRHAAASGVRVSMFRAGFHTGYVPSGVLRLTKAQLDGSSADPRYGEDFFIDLIFAPIAKATAASAGDNLAVNSSASIPRDQVQAMGNATSVTDSGLTIDATSTDKYEQSLHKDARFWETIATRKTRSKRRRSRKFLSSQQDQFSIGDDLGGRSASFSQHEDDDVEVNFMAAAAALRSDGSAAGLSASSASGFSDAELIMQLAQLEGDAPGDSSSSVSDQGVDSDDFTLIGRRSAASAASAATTTPVSKSSSAALGRANMELQALEELEKELGLGDMQLFSGGSSNKAAPTSAAEEKPGSSKQTTPAAKAAPSASATPAAEEEEELDELEKYLQSLSAPAAPL